MRTAQKIGMWKSRLMATALPSTSARSQAPIAISDDIQFGYRVHLGYQSRHACARSLPVTIPSRAARTCMKIAMTLASATTHSSPYLNLSLIHISEPTRQAEISYAVFCLKKKKKKKTTKTDSH